MSKTASIIIAIIILSGAIYYSNHNLSTSNTSPDNVVVNNVEVKDGVQYVTIAAKSGYSPKVSTAKVGMPTKLIVKTNGTYDCSSSLVIKSLNYRNILPNTGDTVIDAGTPKTGDTLLGICGMGMYNFTVNFI